MLTVDQIRKKYLDFFAAKGHTVVASDSLVPKDDPTVLFTTAGMQQFKRQFLGYIDGYTRATSSQKCLRTDDLDQVGNTAFHHTLFEMLGNFSFGDYFKKDAIHWAWEFLTKEVGIPAEKLWVSVYKDDVEAEQIWLKEVGIPSSRLVKLGDKSNFWPSEAREKGPNGPCGPCSEIFFDYGVNPKCPDPACSPACDCGRFAEVWNLVFTQFNRKDGGILEPLPAKNIDTGMGLERLTAVLQGKKNNFETDLFTPLLAALESEILQGRYQLTRREKHIVVDHLRAVVFSISDGVIPSNKERGSVIKRLINESANLILNAGCPGPALYKLVPSCVDTMKGQYPQLVEKSAMAAEMVLKTEEAFIRVRSERIPELEALGLSAMTSAQRGAEYFRFHDTYGLPQETILRIARKQGLSDDLIEEDLRFYEEHMTAQKERSRAGSKMAGDVFVDNGLKLDVPKTKFLGYDRMESRAQVLKIFEDQREAGQVQAGAAVQLVTDQTPFYAEAGGQAGDSGWCVGPSGRARITDTQKRDDVYVHTAVVEQGHLSCGEMVEMTVDRERRLAIMRNHTATHLLQAALRAVLGTHVQQQGSLVAEDRLRFDFTHPKGVTSKEIAEIEAFISRAVLACAVVTKDVMSCEQASKVGALAFFAEKYGETVRVVSIDGYSKEFCGGTHLDTTGQIGLFKVTAESAIAQGIRRIEAKTGLGALELVNRQGEQLAAIGAFLKSPVEEIPERLKIQSNRIKTLEKEIERYQLDTLRVELEEMLKASPVCGAVKIIVKAYQGFEAGVLRRLVDLIKEQTPSAVIVLGSRTSEGAMLLAAVTDDLVKKGVSAGELISRIAPLMGGSGGGRPQMAQAGSKDAGRLDEALAAAGNLIRQKLEAQS